MKKLVELETDRDFEEFQEILAKVREGHVVGTLRQVAAAPNGGYNYVDLQQNVVESNAVLRINGNYFYVTIQNIRRVDVRKLQTMWNMVLQRGTKQFSKGEANDYLLTVDILRDELHKGFVYCVSAVQPILASGEGDNDLTLVFELGNVRCSKDEISQYDVDYEAALREESGNEVYKFHTYEDDFTDDKEDAFSENDDIVNNDEYIENR